MTDPKAKAECAWINNELDTMDRELHGCDWCCGGGDERHDYLLDRLHKLGGKRERRDYGERFETEPALDHEFYKKHFGKPTNNERNES